MRNRSSKQLGSKVDDDALKDIILMNLNDSFSGIHTSLLTQSTEPSLTPFVPFLVRPRILSILVFQLNQRNLPWLQSWVRDVVEGRR